MRVDRTVQAPIMGNIFWTRTSTTSATKTAHTDAKAATEPKAMPCPQAARPPRCEEEKKQQNHSTHVDATSAAPAQARHHETNAKLADAVDAVIKTYGPEKGGVMLMMLGVCTVALHRTLALAPSSAHPPRAPTREGPHQPELD